MPFIDEGLAKGEQVVGAGFDSLAGSAPTPHEATDELRAVAALVGAALAAGHSGVRLIRWMGRCTASTRRLDQQVRIEHLLDRYCMTHPLTCICVYDIGAHDADHIAEVACVHRHADDGLTPFRLSVSGGADLALFGSVDPLCSVVFMETLDRIEVTPGRLVRIDLGDVGFIDHSALLVLDEHGMRRGVVFELQRAPPDAERLVRLLELRYVRLPVEPSIHGRQESRMGG